MKREEIIKRVADLVGEPHTVDLKEYDQMIVVDVYRVGVESYLFVFAAHSRQNILGMSIVGSDFEKLKRFNVAEIYEPTVAVASSRTP